MWLLVLQRLQWISVLTPQVISLLSFWVPAMLSIDPGLTLADHRNTWVLLQVLIQEKTLDLICPN